MKVESTFIDFALAFAFAFAARRDPWSLLSLALSSQWRRGDELLRPP
jgi:hypothetical protein